MNVDQIVLDWSRPYKITLETPNELWGQKGLYAVVHGDTIIYIGKAQSGKGVLAEAKNREGRYANCLKEDGIIPKNMPDKESYEYVRENCVVYVGIAHINQLGLLDGAENLLIFKMQPHSNKQGRKRYRYDPEPFRAINNGIRPPKLPLIVSFPNP